MGLAELRADAKLLREGYMALKDSSTLDARYELAENILPLFEGLCDAISEDLGEVEEELADQGQALDELIDQSSDVLHPETATKILGLFEIGKLLANELERAIAKADDVTKKRVRELIKTYRQGAEVMSEVITEITMPIEPDDPEETGEPGETPEPGKPEDDEAEDDDEEDEDDDEDEDEIVGVKP